MLSEAGPLDHPDRAGAPSDPDIRLIPSPCVRRLGGALSEDAKFHGDSTVTVLNWAKLLLHEYPLLSGRSVA